MRENLQKQIFFSSLYKKLIVWNDMNITPEEWARNKQVEGWKQINTFREELNYIPAKLEF